MKNKLLSLGSLAIVGASAFVVVSCGEEDKKEVVAEINLDTEKNKISNEFDTVDAANKSGNDFTSAEANADVLAKFKEITEFKANKYGMYYALKEALSDGVEIKEAKVKTAYDASSKAIVLTLKIGAEGKDDVEKDITIKFGTTDLSAEVEKISATVALTKSADKAAASEDFSMLAVSSTDVKAKFAKIASITSSGAFTHGSGKLLSESLLASVSINKMVVKQKYASKKMIVTISLAKSGVVAQRATSMKDVEFSFGGIDASDELAKLKSEITSADNSQMSSWTSLTKDSNAKSVYDALGNSRFATGQSSLGSGYDYEVKIKTQLVSATRKVVVTVKLTKSNEANGLEVESATKDVTITFAAA